MKSILKMKNFFFLFIILFQIFTGTAYCVDKKVAIFDYDHRTGNKITIAKYIKKKLKETRLSFSAVNNFEGDEIDVTAFDILSKLDNSGYDLIITITSDSLLPAIRSIKKTPWLFTNVNNPEFYGFSKETGRKINASGVTYYIPAKRQLAFFKHFLNGNLNKIGFIFDYYAKSRRAELTEFRKASISMNLAYEILMIKDENELADATNKMLELNVDAILITSSNKVYEQAGLIESICSARKIPVFSVNKKGVANGAVAAIASDYFKMVDKCLIPMAVNVLKQGKSPKDMKIRSLESPKVYINKKIIRKIGLKIPEDIKIRSTAIN